MKVKVELEVEIDNCHDYDNDDWYDYDMNDVEEYLKYKIGNACSILTKNPLYKDNAEFYITNFIVKRDEEDNV